MSPSDSHERYMRTFNPFAIRPHDQPGNSIVRALYSCYPDRTCAHTTRQPMVKYTIVDYQREIKN